MIFVRISAILAIFASQAIAQEITVKSEPEQKAESEFLKPPGSSGDPYAPAVDWSRVPPWQRTSFFNIRAQGKTFIYVVDCSGSMADRERLIRAKKELRRSVGEMRFPQKFLVIFYNDHPLAMPGGVPQAADLATRNQLASWLDIIDAEGPTDPRVAMAKAIQLKPDGIFLLSDGQFPEGSVEAISKTNVNKIPIHCIDMAGKSGDLKKIAKDSGGEYATRP